VKPHVKSFVLVSLQVLCLLFLFKTSYLHQLNYLAWIFLVIGFCIGIWSVAVFSISQLTVMPEPRGKGELNEKGPYKFVRHPMYAAVLMASLGFVIANPTIISILIYGALVLVLQVKMNHEEQLLKKAYTNYEAYSKRTFKLIPGLY